MYINDLTQAIKFCKVHHLADDTNLAHCSKSLNKLTSTFTYHIYLYQYSQEKSN